MAIDFFTNKPRIGQGDFAGQKEEDVQHPTTSEDSKERINENKHVEAIEARNFKTQKIFLIFKGRKYFTL